MSRKTASSRFALIAPFLSLFLVLIIGVTMIPPALAGDVTIVSAVSDHMLSIPTKAGVARVPYHRTHALINGAPHVSRAIIVIHGANRNADAYFTAIRETIGLARQSPDNVLVIAPQFLRKEDHAAFHLDNSIPYWSGNGWKQGNKSKNKTGPRLSSFWVVDHIVQKLSDRNLFPNLRYIIIIGHSAGGQFVNRYAAGSLTLSSLTRQYRVRCIVANPSSYVYLSKDRWNPNSNAFENGDILRSSCPGYNSYKYGLEDLNTYMAAANGNTIQRQYAVINTIYLLGANDTNPGSANLDKSCEAHIQGNYRLERGQTYFKHIEAYYHGRHNHALWIVPNVGHNKSKMFQSPEGLRALYENF